MANFNKKLVGALAAAAVLASVIPAAATAEVAPAAAPAEKVAKNEVAQDRLIVKMKAGKDTKALANKHGLTEGKALGNSEYKVVNVPAGKVEEFKAKLAADADVESVDFDEVLHMTAVPNDPSYGSQYHLTRIQAPQAWDFTKGSTAYTIAVIDTGVDKNHADLKSKLVAGYDFVNNDTDAHDDQGHGTHVAGISAASTNNALNGAGVDWYAKIMPIKVLSASGSGYTTDIIDGVYWAADHGAKVINMSLGGGSSNSAFQSAINYAWNKGVIVVAAAGNSSTSAYSYPAAYSNVISVASTTSTDSLSTFSNYGTWVDVAAPGQSIYSTRLGGGMTTMSGTSMASPVVAGLASLVWSKNPAKTATAVRDRIFTTADRITGTGTKFWYGRVNAYRAVNGF